MGQLPFFILEGIYFRTELFRYLRYDSTTTFSSTRKAGHHHRRRRRHHCARRGTRQLHAAEPRRREGWEREGVYRGTRHLRAAEAKKARCCVTTRTRARPRTWSKPNASTDAYRHLPWPAPNCPLPNAPQKILHQRFLHRCALFFQLPQLF